MTALTFPSNPQQGDIYQAPNNLQYYFDGVKWVVQTTTTTSQDITNFVQDAVAPVFTNIQGNGITFSYDSNTNTLTADVTGGANTGNISFVNDDMYDLNGITIENADLTHGATAAVVIPANGSSGAAQLNNTYGSVIITSGAGNVTQQWEFGGDGVLTSPNQATQHDTSSVMCPVGVDTVIYTAPSPWKYTIKLLIQAEGNETQGQQWDTQSSEMIVAKSWRNDTVVASVYGVVHTSVDPLVTYSARWNATLSRVEVLARPTSATFNIYVRTFATEIVTSD